MKANSVAVNLLATRMGPPHLGQCQSGASWAAVLAVESGARPSSVSNRRASGMLFARKRLESSP